jgi:hypothetical protein
MPIGKGTESAGARLAAMKTVDVITATVIRDYHPAGRTLARAGERVRLLDMPDREGGIVYVYREGKRYARGIPSDYLELEPVEAKG